MRGVLGELTRVIERVGIIMVLYQLEELAGGQRM